MPSLLRESKRSGRKTAVMTHQSSSGPLSAYHDVDMLQPVPRCLSLAFPNLRQAIRMTDLPNIRQTRMAKPNGAEGVVEEVRDWPPAEVGMIRWVSFSFENPVGWYLRNGILVSLMDGFESFR